jgi:phosphoribosylamine--glycine ligase
MGAYAPVSLGTSELSRRVEREILLPTLEAMRAEGTPFTGLLYAGLMLTPGGPRVVEFNCRFGDPETQAILPLLASSLLEPALSIARGESIAGAAPLQWKDAASVATVVAAPGYPDRPETGEPIELPARANGVCIFHAGTRRDGQGRLMTAGGRVLAVTGVAPTLREARDLSVGTAGQVRFPGRHYRRDIGWRELNRHAGAS